MAAYVHKSKYFYGNKISDYGLEMGYIDYQTLAQCFDSVLCNDITKLFWEDINGKYNECELVNGCDYDNENDEYIEIYQYYIIDDNGSKLLQELTNEIVYYVPLLDIYVWGVTHYGTAWSHVLTNIKIELEV